MSRRHERGRRQWGNALIVTGLVLIAAALSLVAYNLWDSARAGREASEIARQLEADSDVSGDASDGEMPYKTIDGYDYIGTIEVPSLDISLPVMRDWDYDRLRVSPCRYTGSYLTDDLVICGHNYPSHFRRLLGVDIGADVYLDTVDGKRLHYVVGNRETLQPTSIEQMVENDKNSESPYDWDLTIFTCNLGGQTRCAVRCIRESA